MKIINAINKVKSSDKHRPNINSIYLDAKEQKIVACDGNMLVVHEPTETIEKSQLIDIPKLAGKELEIDLVGMTATNEKGMSMPIKEVDATYPPYHRITVDSALDSITSTITLDIDQLKAIVDSFNLPGRNIVTLEVHRPEQPIIIKSNRANAIGYLTPCRSN